MARLLRIALLATLIGSCSPATPTTGVSSPTPAPSQADSSPSPYSPAATDPVQHQAIAFAIVLQRDDVQLTSIVAHEGGFVVGGCILAPLGSATVRPCDHGLILASPDGTSWHEVPLPDSARRQVVGLAVTNLGLLAFGSTQEPEPPRHRVLWRSKDGERWESFAVEAPPTIVFEMAVSLGARTVLIGSDAAFDIPAQTEAWATVDGLTWSSGTTPLGLKVAAHPGLVAVGDQCLDCGRDPLIQVFRSLDGFTWIEDAVPQGLGGIGLQDLVSRGGRVVVAGVERLAVSNQIALWFDLPAGWRGVEIGVGSAYPSVRLVPALGGLILVADNGTPAGAAAAWWSADGQVWIPAWLDGVDGPITASAGDDPVVMIQDQASILVSSP